jgi:hypothetical protein
MATGVHIDCYRCRLVLIVVEAALARFVVALAPLWTALAAPLRTTRILEPAAGSAGSAGTAAGAARAAARKVRAPISHGTAVATAIAATTSTAAAISAAAATATVATATTAIAAATTRPAATAAAIGRTGATRTKSAAATAATAESAAATGLAFDGFAHGDRPTIEQGSVHGLHRCSTLVICFHLEEGKAAAAASLAIHDHF